MFILITALLLSVLIFTYINTKYTHFVQCNCKAKVDLLKCNMSEQCKETTSKRVGYSL